MDINLIKRLIKIVEQSEVTEFSVQEGDLKIKISKNSSNIPHVQYQHVSQAPVPTEVKVDTGENVIEKPAATSTKLHEIKSPIVGTFYRAPSPDAEPYVQVGD